MVVAATKKIRSVPVYLDLLEQAGKADRTISTYRDSLKFYAGYLGVPLDQLHLHYSVDNLMAYLRSDRIRGLKPNSRRTAIASISRYMKTNGVEFDELEMNVVKVRQSEVREDKPLEYETARRMMDLADTHMKAVISFWISTGCRIGETSKILLSDVRGDVVTVRPEIAKRRRGGKVYLNAEAREFLDLWLKERDAWIVDANRRARSIRKPRPKHDERLFACSAGSLSYHFGKLYDAVDGEKIPIAQGERGMVTPHSCRAYFRTHAAKSMGPDLPEGIMRHTGYLNAAYVRMSDEERERLYHEGEHVLYITRKDQRVQDGELARLREEVAGVADLKGEMAIMRKWMDDHTKDGSNIELNS